MTEYANAFSLGAAWSSAARTSALDAYVEERWHGPVEDVLDEELDERDSVKLCGIAWVCARDSIIVRVGGGGEVVVR